MKAALLNQTPCFPEEGASLQIGVIRGFYFEFIPVRQDQGKLC
jgi:hypothetical protein